MAEFDFDYWANLARSDPPAFFAARERAISGFIEDHPPEQAERLRKLQAHIDCVRASSASPANATRQLAVMLEEHVAALRAAMERLVDLSEGLGGRLPPP